MPKRRLQHQETVQDENQNQSKQLDHSRRRAVRSNLPLLPPIVGIGLLGALIGSVHPVGQSVLLGAFLGALLGDLGLVVLVFLVRSRRLLTIQKRGKDGRRDKRQSLLSFFWWSGVLLITALVGAILGSIFLPDTLLLLSKILLGALIGLVGLALLLAVIADPVNFFAEGVVAFLESGCCLAIVALFLAIPGTISGLLLWHSLLLGVFTGAGSVLVALIAFVSLTFPSRKERRAHGSQAIASVGNSAGSA